MKRLLLLTAFLLCGVAFAAAQVGGVTGRVVSRSERIPIVGAQIVLSTQPAMTATSGEDGLFEFTGIPYGQYVLTVDAEDFQSGEINVKVDLPVRNVNFVTLVPVAATVDLDASSFGDFDMESGGTSQALPTTLSASRDVFDNIAGYTFGQMRFRTRGYDGATEAVYMNGILLNDAMTGYTPWSLWSGLNDVTRNQESESAMSVNRFGVGGVNGITQLNSRPSELRTGFRTSLVGATAQYLTRVMASYASGMQDNGWAYAFSFSTRQGPNLWVQGVYYDAWAYYAGIEKQFNPQHRLSLIVLGVPTERGAQMAATDEVYSMVGSNFYNPNWGWQDGRIRNARVRSYHEPLAILNYDWQMSEKLKFSVAASFRFGSNGYSALDWNNAADPKPDYHRNLPSYYNLKDQFDKGTDLWYYWNQNKDGIAQINWDRIYNINYNSTNDVDKDRDPDGNLLDDGRSVYIISERHTDQLDGNLRATFNYQIAPNQVLNFGLAGRMDVTNYYTSVKDLLGGQYWVNADNFAERDFGGNLDVTRNDLERDDNFIVHKGDKYGYDYYGHVTNAQLWGNYNIELDGLQLFAAGEAGIAQLYKDSKYRKGLFPGEFNPDDPTAPYSFGVSEKPVFLTYKVKAGATYSFTPQHQISLSGAVLQEAPNFDDAFISPRTRNNLIPNLKESLTVGGDLTYQMRTRWLTLRASLYYTYISNLSRVISFYDDLQNAFTNFAMSGIDQQHTGLELGFRVPLIAELTLNGAINLGYYTYANNPTFIQTADNSAEIINENVAVNWKGYYLESTPQTAISLGLNWRVGNNWYLGLNASYYDRMYLSMNPLLRSDSFKAKLTDADGTVSQVYYDLAKEQKFDPAFVLNASVGHNWYVNRKYQLGFSLDLKNLLNDTTIRTGGFEQMRVHSPSKTQEDYSAFDPKYYYLFGFNVYLNLYLRF